LVAPVPAADFTAACIVPAASAGVRPVTHVDMKSLAVSVPERMKLMPMLPDALMSMPG
jgi:hypothetical protein